MSLNVSIMLPTSPNTTIRRNGVDESLSSSSDLEEGSNHRNYEINSHAFTLSINQQQKSNNSNRSTSSSRIWSPRFFEKWRAPAWLSALGTSSRDHHEPHSLSRSFSRVDVLVKPASPVNKSLSTTTSSVKPMVYATGYSMHDEIDSKVMENLHQWPFVAITLIHARLIFFQLTHEQFQKNEGNCLISFTLISGLSFLALVASQCFRKVVITNFKFINLSKLDSFAVLFITTCFCALLMLLTFHDRHIPSGKHVSLMFEGHAGCTLHNEFMFYVMMMPYLLFARSVHAMGSTVYTAWLTSFLTTCTSLMLVTIHDHAKYSFTYAISLTIVSLAILVHSRRQRVSECHVYRQFEDLKSKYNDLSLQLEEKQKEIVAQRYILANTAHDLKTVSFIIFDTITGI